MKTYQTILADPPWQYREGWPGWGKRRALPYPSMTVEQIKALPVAPLLNREGYLFLWTTNRYLEAAFSVARAWGCTHRQTLTWCKEPNGDGPGGMFAVTTEFLLVAQKIREGTNAHGRRTKGERINTSWFQFPRGRHSAKPEQFIEMVERVSAGPYLELFARPRGTLFPKREGWDVWGDEVQSDIELEVA